MLGDMSLRVYDENFSMLRESSDLPWQKPVEQAAVLCNFQSQQPFRTNAGSRPIKFRYAFNNIGSCSHNPCPYIQKCQLCSMSHARVNQGEDKNKVQSTQPKSPNKSDGIQLPLDFVAKCFIYATLVFTLCLVFYMTGRSPSVMCNNSCSRVVYVDKLTLFNFLHK